MIRNIGSVIAGYAAWTVLWLVGNALLFAQAREVVTAGEAFEQTGPLVGILALSVFCSVVAGVVTARIAQGNTARVVLVMAILLLATGIAVQAGVWSLMPTWYHVLFLLMLIPVAATAGRWARPTTSS